MTEKFSHEVHHLAKRILTPHPRLWMERVSVIVGPSIGSFERGEWVIEHVKGEDDRVSNPNRPAAPLISIRY